jgi:hypothetical protein
MRNKVLLAALLISSISFTQESEKVPETPQEAPKEVSDPDTVRFKLGRSEVTVVTPPEGMKIPKTEEIDTIDAAPPKKHRRTEAHWGGLELGFNVNLNAVGSDKFDGYKYWENDPSKSIYVNFNFMEKKFNIIKEYVGLTTGLGINFNSIGFKNNYVLVDSTDVIYANVSPINYMKNKLKASYFQVPLMLEFNTHADNSKGLYIAAGVIGGVRMTSKVKRSGEIEGDSFEEKQKGTYSLNPFKLDATARIGHDSWGGFINYSLIPLFDTQRTVAVHPLTFGLTYGF